MILEFKIDLGQKKVKQEIPTIEAENIPKGAVEKVMEIFKDYNITHQSKQKS